MKNTQKVLLSTTAILATVSSAVVTVVSCGDKKDNTKKGVSSIEKKEQQHLEIMERILIEKRQLQHIK